LEQNRKLRGEKERRGRIVSVLAEGWGNKSGKGKKQNNTRGKKRTTRTKTKARGP